MAIQVVLLRGINVGGKNSLPMQELREILSGLGCKGIMTYIQSGNVVFSSDGRASALPRRIRQAIEEQFGFSPLVLMLPGKKIKQIADANPYSQEGTDPKLVHICFLAETATAPDVERMRCRMSASERFALTDDALYLYTPEGIARSKLAAEVEKCLGVPTTARNWRTVCKLVEMVEEAG